MKKPLQPKTANLGFYPSAVAATWPEGSTVLFVTLIGDQPAWRSAKISCWHHPHSLTRDHALYDKYRAQFHWALLALPELPERKGSRPARP